MNTWVSPGCLLLLEINSWNIAPPYVGLPSAPGTCKVRVASTRGYTYLVGSHFGCPSSAPSGLLPGSTMLPGCPATLLLGCLPPVLFISPTQPNQDYVDWLSRLYDGCTGEVSACALGVFNMHAGVRTMYVRKVSHAPAGVCGGVGMDTARTGSGGQFSLPRG